MVAAAGNNGPSPTDIEEPSVCIGVVTVGAIDSTGTVASFSSRTPKMTVTAPGVNIPSLGRIAGQAYQGKGTSQASALTSAALALIWSKYPTLTNRQVVARLLATLDSPRTSADPAYGYGQINPASAINTAVPANAPNPVYDVSDPFVAQLTTPNAVPAPAAAPTTAAPPGHYTAAKSPSSVTNEVKTASGVAIAGLIVLLLLIVFGVRGPPAADASARRVGLGRFVDVDRHDTRWHDVFEPPAWAAPEQPPTWTAPPGPPTVVYPPPTLAEVAPPEPPAQWLPPAHPPPRSALSSDPIESADDRAQ